MSYLDFFDEGTILQAKAPLSYDRKLGQWSDRKASDDFRTMTIEAGERLLVQEASEETLTLLTDHWGEIELAWPEGSEVLEPYTGRVAQASKDELPPTLVRRKYRQPDNWKHRAKVIRRV